MSRQFKIFFEAVIIFLLMFSVFFLLMNILNKQQSWQTIECWNETTDKVKENYYWDKECKEAFEKYFEIHPSYSYAKADWFSECLETIQICKEGRGCEEEITYIEEACGYKYTNEMEYCLIENGYYVFDSEGYQSDEIFIRCGKDFGMTAYCKHEKTKLICQECRNSLTKERMEC